MYFFPTQNNGCGLYRSWNPAAALERTGLCEVRCGPDEPEEITVERAEKLFQWADVVYTQLFTSLWASSFFVATRDYYKKKLIIDLDDSVWDIHPMNVGAVNGKLFKLSNHFSENPDYFWDIYKMTDEQWDVYINAMTPEDRQIADKPTFMHGTMLNLEGQKVFVKQKEQDAISSATFYLSHADAVTTTNPHLANVIRKHTAQKNIFILPNCLNPSDWSSPQPARNPNEVWIGWSGSISHYPDLLPLMPVMDRLMERHPQLRVQMMGSCFEYLFPPKSDAKAYGVGGYGGDDQPLCYNWSDCGERWPGRMRFDRPVPIRQYSKWMTETWASDIAIAPLEDNDFNKAKSELKWCEYSMLGVPTVASKFGPYKRAIRHGVDGLLAGSPRAWENALEDLIESAELRHRIAAEARARVLDEYNADRQAHRWLEIFERIAQPVREEAVC